MGSLECGHLLERYIEYNILHTLVSLSSIGFCATNFRSLFDFIYYNNQQKEEVIIEEGGLKS
jgi:hypothetical protein